MSDSTEVQQRDATVADSEHSEEVDTLLQWITESGWPGRGYASAKPLVLEIARLRALTGDEERPYPPVAPENRTPGCWVHDTTREDCDACKSSRYPEGPRGVLLYRADLLDYLRSDPTLALSLRNELARTASAIRMAAATQAGTPAPAASSGAAYGAAVRLLADYERSGNGTIRRAELRADIIAKLANDDATKGVE